MRTFTTRYDHIGAMEVEIVRDKGAPFSSFIAAYLVAKTLAPHSKRDYERYLQRYDEFTGRVSLEEALTLDRAAPFIEHMRGSGIFAAHNACMVLKSFASWIAKSRYIQIPGGGSLLAGLEAPTTPRGRRTAFTDAQMDAIWKEMSDWPDRQRVRATTLLKFLAATGMRRNEARQVLIRDLEIDFKTGRGAVRVRAATSKGMKQRLTRLDPEAIKWIDLYLNAPQHVSRRPEYRGPRNEPEPLFLTEAGKAFTEFGWSTFCDKIWKEIHKATGIKGSSHLMRHTWATNYNRGMQFTGNNVYDLKREGGWSDLTIPLTYTHDRPEAELLEMPTPMEALRQRRVKSA